MCFNRRNEFRTNGNKESRGHPAYIYQKVGDSYKFIGITHSPITHKVRNIKLDKNPNPNDPEDSYARPRPGVGKIKRFGKKKKGWKLSKSDKEKMREIAKKAK